MDLMPYAAAKDTTQSVPAQLDSKEYQNLSKDAFVYLYIVPAPISVSRSKNVFQTYVDKPVWQITTVLSEKDVLKIFALKFVIAMVIVLWEKYVLKVFANQDVQPMATVLSVKFALKISADVEADS